MRQRAAAADHVADVLLGELVVGQVEGREAVAFELAREQRRFGAVDGRDADEDVRHRGIGDAVVELGHRARADQLAEAPEAAALLGNRHREQGLALLADLGALGDEAQAIEVHVGAAGDRDVGLAAPAVRVHVLLDRGDAERAGRLEDAARVLEHVLDRGAGGVGVDDDPFVDQLAREAKGLVADALDRGAVGEQADVGELDARDPRVTERSIASESVVCTPMTRISGRTALM